MTVFSYRLPSEIGKILYQIAKIKNKSSAKFQAQIELFKKTLRKYEHLQWNLLDRKVPLEIYQAMGEVISEGIMRQLDYVCDRALPESLTVLAPFLKNSKLTKLVLKLDNEDKSDNIAFFAQHLPLTLTDLTLDKLKEKNLPFFLKNLDEHKLNSLAIIGSPYKDDEKDFFLTTESAELLSEIIQKHPLKELTFHNILTLITLERLAPSIEKSEIRVLNQMLYNKEKEDDAKICQVFAQICAKSKITEIKLEETIRTSAGFKIFVDNLPNTPLKRLSLNKTRLELGRPRAGDVKHLANAIPNTLLEYLSFDNNELDLNSAGLLANKLKGTHLTQIPDGIKKAAYEILAPALKRNKERQLKKHALMKTTLDPYLPRVTTDLIEGYLTQNPELLANETFSVLEERSKPILKKHQQLSEEPAENKSKIKRRKM